MKWCTGAILAPAVMMVLLASKAAPQTADAGTLLTKQCDENALQLRLAPEPFNEIVGSQFRLAVQDGKTPVVIVVQDCSQSWLGGTDMGPAQYAHVWVLIEGPRDVRPVFGAQQTRPTMTWLSLFAGSTNAREREVRKKSALTPEPLDRVSVGRPGSPAEGRVVLAAGLSYSWDVPAATPSASLVGLNHDVYTRDVAGAVVLRQIQALGNLVGGPAAATLHVVGGTESKRLIGPGDYPVTVTTYAPIWIRTLLTMKGSQ